MIRINELRIGNKVLFRDGLKGNWHKVVVSGIIGSDKISHHPQIWYSSKMLVGSTNDLECIKPIPLTEEILLKCGFKDKLPWEKGNIILDSENRLSVVDSTGYGVIAARNVIYLHQLQNLYFVLTGKELEVKL